MRIARPGDLPEDLVGTGRPWEVNQVTTQVRRMALWVVVAVVVIGVIALLVIFAGNGAGGGGGGGGY